MGYLPIFVQVSGRRCVVIGGGEIAERKTLSLLEAGAEVIVVSPALTTGLAALARRGRLRHHAREYQAGDLAGAFFAFETSGDPRATHAAVAEARADGVLINVADVPERCDFIAPAVIKRGALQLAISTGGASPALARQLREELEGRFGTEYELLLDLLAAARQWLRAREQDSAVRTRILTALAASGLREALRDGKAAETDAILRRILGASLIDLGCDPARFVATVPSQQDSTPERPVGASR